MSKKNKICSDCGVPCYSRKNPTLPSLCRKCFNTYDHPEHQGPNNGRWRGGHKYWSAGRRGRDKDGLSWKVQQRLAQERAKGVCEFPGCGKTEIQNGRRLDTDHKNPWMNSQSHHLDNLWCLCRSCHHREEAKRPEVWGGKTLGGHLNPSKKKGCLHCSNKKRKLTAEGFCSVCIRERNIQLAKELREDGKTYQQIADFFQICVNAAYKWVNKVR